jgi:hypothetical protein
MGAIRAAALLVALIAAAGMDGCASQRLPRPYCLLNGARRPRDVPSREEIFGQIARLDPYALQCGKAAKYATVVVDMVVTGATGRAQLLYLYVQKGHHTRWESPGIDAKHPVGVRDTELVKCVEPAVSAVCFAPFWEDAVRIKFIASIRPLFIFAKPL